MKCITVMMMIPAMLLSLLTSLILWDDKYYQVCNDGISDVADIRFKKSKR